MYERKYHCESFLSALFLGKHFKTEDKMDAAC